VSSQEFPTDPKIDVLVNRFPRLFRGRHPRAWSDLPDGWTGVADRLFNDLDAMMSDDEAATFEIVQIKEKFGGLRVYWELDGQQTMVIDAISAHSVQHMENSPARPTALFGRVRERVRQAAQQAATTCQKCGSEGATATRSGWVVTLCEACRAKKVRE